MKYGDATRFSQKQAENILLKHGLRLLDTYTNCDTKIKCIDSNGYKYYTTVYQVSIGNMPHVVGKNNPYSIDNINNTLKINHSKTICISDKYVSANDKLEFVCGICGKHYFRKYGDFLNTKHMCKECGMRGSNKTNDNVINDKLVANGLHIINGHENQISNRPLKIDCVDDFGYKYIITSRNISCYQRSRYNKNNPYTIENINHYLSTETNGEYICLSNEYNGHSDSLIIKHMKCGNIFTTTWQNLYRKPSLHDVNRHGTRCPYCTSKRIESIHAIVLKQVFLHEKDNVVVEDRSCINPKTNCAMPTDIVDYGDKIAIEIQSWFHDNGEYRHWKDNYKKEYWINRGFTFYAIDQRDYTPLSMVKLFFPYIKHIPDYVNIDYANKLNEFEVKRINTYRNNKIKVKCYNKIIS